MDSPPLNRPRGVTLVGDIESSMNPAERSRRSSTSSQWSSTMSDFSTPTEIMGDDLEKSDSEEWNLISRTNGTAAEPGNVGSGSGIQQLEIPPQDRSSSGEASAINLIIQRVSTSSHPNTSSSSNDAESSTFPHMNTIHSPTQQSRESRSWARVRALIEAKQNPQSSSSSAPSGENSQSPIPSPFYKTHNHMKRLASQATKRAEGTQKRLRAIHGLGLWDNPLRQYNEKDLAQRKKLMSRRNRRRGRQSAE